MRIQFLLTQSLESPSGLGRYGPLARQLARLGHSVELFALHPDWHNLAQRVWQRDGVTIRYVAPMHVKKAGSRKSYYSVPRLITVSARATIALLSAALSHRADIIHIAKAQPMNGLAGWLAARLTGRSLYLDCDDYEAASNRISAAWQRRIVTWWEDFLPGQVRAVSVNTSFLRQRCESAGVPADRIRLVPNGFDPERFSPIHPDERADMRGRRNLEHKAVVIYLGSLSLTNHPVLLLLEAFAEVVRRLPSAHLLLVGGGEDFDRVGQAVAERGLNGCVTLAGRVEPGQARSMYGLADVSVDPVNDDDVARARSPLKIVESLACGVPIVTGDVGDRSLMLGGGSAGVLVAAGQPAALAGGLLRILAEPGYQQQLAIGALALSQQYRWDRLAQNFAGLYSDAAAV